jgi:hypothetical protein
MIRRCLRLLQTMRVETNVKIDEDFVDTDELQLMDECNRVWVQAWKEAIACPDVMKAVLIEGQENRDGAEHPHPVKL